MNLYEQLETESCRAEVARIIGITLYFDDGKAFVGFRNKLKEIPAIRNDYTTAEAAIAYLLHCMASATYLRSIN